jgi:transcriptional regulator with XRE-family HTH domain
VNTDPPHNDVPQTVARACTESAGTVQALAQEVGVSYAALCSWSRGRRQPPAHRLRRLADVLEDRAGRLREIAAELRTLTENDARRAAAPLAIAADSPRPDGRIPMPPSPAPTLAAEPGLAARRRDDTPESMRQPSTQRPKRAIELTP